MKKMLILFVCLFIVSCASAKPTPEELSSADYGPPPSNPEAIIHSIIGPRLVDPDSAKYSLSVPVKGGNDISGKRAYGWRVCGMINSKNRFGGYSGPKPIFAMIYNDRIIRLLSSGFTIPDSLVMGMTAGIMVEQHSSESLCRD